MARARNIKPGFFTNEELANLPPVTRLLFAGLWTVADREGRLEDRPKRIKAEVLPYDNCDVNRALDQLAAAGFITRYEVGGRRCVAVSNWIKHQRPHHMEVASELPPPPCVDSPRTSRERVDDGSSTDRDRLVRNDSCPTDSLNPITDSSSLNPQPEGVVVSMLPQRAGPPIDSDDLWTRYWGVFVAAGLALNEADKARTLRAFLSLDANGQRAALADAEAKSTDGTWPDENKTQRPWNHLDGKPWTRVAQPRTLPRTDRDEPAGLRILKQQLGESA